jgi:adenosylcobalamin-dependent ribonucleoside-triphosphate reductase
MKFPIEQRFKLADSFIEKYKSEKPKFGFGGLGEFVFMRTYSRIKPQDGKNEAWYETVKRVVEGIYTIQKQHIEDYRLGWNQVKAQKSAQEMYDRIFNFKMLGSGRAFWALGTDIVMVRGLTESLYNCSFISSSTIKENPSDPFMNAMDFLMLGVGVGFDTRGAGKVIVKEPKDNPETYVITDDREGWVKSVGLCIDSFFGGNNYEFDYSLIRKAGEPIRTFGGVSAGHKPLKQLHETIRESLSKNIGKPITETCIADIINSIGVAVVSGNVRRSAELLVGSNSEEFLDLKNYKKNKERSKIGWASNNSIIAEVGMDYLHLVDRISDNAEPGVLWLSNMQKFGRMRADEENNKDKRVIGVNPCSEVTLEDRELCNLVEIIPSNHEDIEDFKQTIKYAYLFAKTITLLNTNWAETNKVMLRNRRIGLSLTGITQFISERGMGELKNWMESGYSLIQKYDNIYSEWFAIPKSIKTTTVKPSGTLSLLAGVTPGIHFPESRYYIRRVRLSKNSPYVNVLKKSNYHIEDSNEDPENTCVVEFPVSLGNKVKTINETTMWEQMNLASFAQENWSDNAVSVTITFKKNEKEQIKSALDMFQFKLKSVSFLPKLDNETPYKQMPYEEISEKEYEKRSKNILPLDFSEMLSVDSKSEMYCNDDVCMVL